MLQSIISQSTEEKSYPIEVTKTITDVYRVGDRRSILPSVLWQNGVTFFAATKINTGFNNQIQILQYDHNFGSFSYKDVGNGTDPHDIYNHPISWVWAENETIYSGQTNPHNAVIDIYKPLIDNNYISGYEQLTSVSGENSYPQVFKTVTGKTAFCVRHDFVYLSVQISDSDIEGTFTRTVITENQAGYRQYNGVPIIYGTPTKNYLFANFRNNFANNYFLQAVFVTTDFINYSNVAGTFSKDIVADGEITMAEIETYFVVNGSFDEDEVDFEVANIIQIDDVVYYSSTKAGTTDKYLFKIQDGEVTSEIINIPNLDPIYRNPILYYNGLNILISVLCDDSGTKTKEIWKVDLDLGSYAQQYVLSDFNQYQYIFLPDNLDKVNGEYAMYIDQATNEGTFLLTDNKWAF